MISVAEAQAAIRRRARVLPSEAVSLHGVHGRLLREPIVSLEDIPAFDRSAMDGYAVRADEKSEEWKIVGEIRAGQNIDREIRPGEAMRIFTGARLPGSGLRVVMQENVEAQGDRARLMKPSDDLYIRRKGEDARAGEILLGEGARLNAAAVALLASVGKTSVLVSPICRVLHLTTGDEIVPPGQLLRMGEIRNSNAFLVSALCREWGGETTHLHAPDDLETMKNLLSQAADKNYEMVLISGGSGAGKYDFSGELFRFLGAEIQFQQVSVRPGKPLIFGGSTSQLVFGLPGNALSHFVCFHLFVRPALARMRAAAENGMSVAIMADELPETGNSRETWWPARLNFRDGRVEVRALSWKSSGDITRLPSADALIRVPAATPHLPVGAHVEYLSLREEG